MWRRGAPAVCLALRGKRKRVARLPFPNTRRAAYALGRSALPGAVFSRGTTRWTDDLDARPSPLTPARCAWSLRGEQSTCRPDGWAGVRSSGGRKASVSVLRRKSLGRVWRSHMRSAPPRLRVNLTLVPVGRAYRPALPISQRAELATAFAQGEARCASGPSLDEQQMQELMGLSADARTAYRLGAVGPDGCSRPRRLPLRSRCCSPKSSPRHWRGRPTLSATGSRSALPLSRRSSIPSASGNAQGFGAPARSGSRPRPLRFPRRLASPCARCLAGCSLSAFSRCVCVAAPAAGRVSLSSSIAAAAIHELRVRQDWNAAYKRAKGSA